MADPRLLTFTPIEPNGPPRGFYLFGNGNLTGGVGGWEVLDRPRQLAATEWVSQPPHGQQVTIVLTGMGKGTKGSNASIETDRQLVRSWGKSPGGGAQPPRLVLAGPIELPAPWTQWILQDIAVSTDIDTIRSSAGVLVQQALTLTLVEWTGASILLSPAAAARARAGKT